MGRFGLNDKPRQRLDNTQFRAESVPKNGLKDLAFDHSPLFLKLEMSTEFANDFPGVLYWSPLSEGQMSDHKGARLVLNALPPASSMIADRGYDSTWFREELAARGIQPCIPSSRSRKRPYPYDKVLYRQRHKIENLFAKLKDWRRVATRYDRCAHTFFSAICIAAIVIFWL